MEFERRIDSRKESYDGTFRSYVSFSPDARGHSDQRFHPGTTPFSNRFVRAWEEVWVWINLSPLTETLTRAISTKMPSSPCNALDGRFSVRDRQ